MARLASLDRSLLQPRQGRWADRLLRSAKQIDEVEGPHSLSTSLLTL